MSKFDISFIPRTTMKAQLLADFKIEHIPKEQNQFADVFSKLENIHGTINTKLSKPNIEEPEVMKIDQERITGWMNPLIEYLKSEINASEIKDHRQFRIKVALYVLIDEELFRKFVSVILLRWWGKIK